LLGIWSENTTPAPKAFNVTISSALIQGNIRGAGTAECSDGIGLVGVNGARILGVHIKDQTNIAPPGGGETTGLNIVQCSDVEVEGLRVETDTAITNRMQNAVKLSGSNNIVFRGGSQTGVSDTPILYDATLGAECSDIRIEAFRGGTDDETWGNLVKMTFAAQNVAVSSTVTLLPVGAAGMDGSPLPCPGRVVAMTVRGGSGQVFTGNYTFKTLAAGVEQTTLNLTQAGLVTVSGASQGRAKRGSASAAQYAAGALIAATLTTDGSWTATHDVYVDVWIDIGLKV
jgi:hypothetical protein